ncbi:MAG: hypothetical protein ACFBSG_00855 [Leptolyngbyaceae cyanobacterium]
MANSNNSSFVKLITVTGITAVLFAIGLLIFERIPEIPVDIDWKPFFIVYAIIALLPLGGPTWAAGFGAAVGEGFLDLIEGYEVDDPFGFIGYIVGFAVAGYIFRNQPKNKMLLVFGAIVGAAVQAAFEAAALMIFGEEGFPVALRALLGNTFTHGIALGAIPLLMVVPLLYGRVERLLGYSPAQRESGTTARTRFRIRM